MRKALWTAVVVEEEVLSTDKTRVPGPGAGVNFTKTTLGTLPSDDVLACPRPGVRCTRTHNEWSRFVARTRRLQQRLACTSVAT